MRMKHIGLITAFLSEGTALLGRGKWNFSEGLFFRTLKLSSEKKLLCVASGMGRECAVKGARFLLIHGVTEILNMGVAAGLTHELRVGDIVYASAVESLEGLSISLDSKKKDLFQAGLKKNMKIRTGKLLTVTVPLLTSNEKINAHDKTGAIAADMESLWVGLEAQAQDVPFSAFRSISDSVENRLMFNPSDIVDPFGRFKERAFLKVVRTEPRLLFALPELALNYSKALKGLRHSWQKLLIIL